MWIGILVLITFGICAIACLVLSIRGAMQGKWHVFGALLLPAFGIGGTIVMLVARPISLELFGDPNLEILPESAEAILAEPRWPERPAGLRPAWEAYFRTMSDLAARLLSIMAVGLGLSPDHFEPFLPYHSSAMRAINYPHLDARPLPGQLRAGAHTDYGTLSILRFDEAPGGLEVMGPEGWAAVPMVPGGFVVNLGDMMARWTNDRWVSTLHRAALPPPGAEGSTRRQSIVFFHNVAWDAEVRCLPTCLAPGESPRYDPVLAGPHLLGKFASTVESTY